ncbi:tyrosine-type recombinase/integrase [Streptomyces sp. NPDC019224]|uniref:tyrosine-type recombinase/integrase n=1 Tax=Streptomyces sp. NPDC019224 TaxID=3154484 RepID=UPI0033F70046
MQADSGQRPSEALAFSTECRRPGFVRIRWQVSSMAHRADCRMVFVPLKNRTESEYRDVPTVLFVDQEMNAHLSTWKPVPVIFIGQKSKRCRLEAFFSPRSQGKGAMPTASTYGYHFKKECQSAGLVGPDGKATYTPGSLRHFFASTALTHGVPIHEVSRWLAHRSVKTTIDIYGHLLPSAWGHCRTVLQNAMRPAPLIAADRAVAPVGSGVSVQATSGGDRRGD